MSEFYLKDGVKNTPSLEACDACAKRGQPKLQGDHMKSFLLALVFVCSSAFAAEKMNDQAVEMAAVMTQGQVRECLKNVNLGEMVNVSITKQVYRCPMCNTYVITGNEIVEGDIISPEKTKITLVGKGVPGFGFGFVQTFTCKIEKK